ncbi:amine oxidase [Fonsecaea pedrosoi]|nr:amine oxidase [Fonsecaea pedrosoi]
MSKRVAIVGSGCSGLGALWALNTSTSHEVHLFEATSRLGGHTKCISYEGPNGQTIQVDAGLLAINNNATSPNFVRFLQELGVPVKKTAVTFGVSRDQGAFEWAWTSWSSVFAQRRNIFCPDTWKLVFEVIRFKEFALDLLQDDDGEDEPIIQEIQQKRIQRRSQERIGEYLDRENYSQGFRDNYLIPMVAAILGTNLVRCILELPAVTVVRSMYNQHMLNMTPKSSNWWTIPGGSGRYIEAVVKDVPDNRIHLDSKVTSLTPGENGIVVLRANGKDHGFDHVIVATQCEQALEMLQPIISREESDILKGFRTDRVVAVLHSDLTLMPKRRQAWSSLNFVSESLFPPTRSKNVSRGCLTYWMNVLQELPESQWGPILITLNPLHMPDPRLAQGIWEYSLPLYDAAAIKSQKLLSKIQNTKGISYCGAWTKCGFHEDGFSSGLSVAVGHLGANLPFDFVDPTLSGANKPMLTLKNYLLRLVILLVQIMVLLVERACLRMAAVIDKRIASRRKTA